MIADSTMPTDVSGYDPQRDSAGCYFDESEADRRIQFFEKALKHTKGHIKGHPFLLEDWEKAVVATAFGWKKESDRTRRYREVFVFIPRKNGKTTLAAGFSLCVLFCDNEGGAECYMVAGDLDQTDMVYGTAAEMIRQTPTLDSKSTVRDSRKRIVFEDKFLRAIPADDKGAHGFNLHFVCGDELHVWKDRHMKDTLHTGTGFRTQPLEVYITTAGFDLQTIAGETYQYACNVRDGVIKDPAFLPVIYEAPKDADWKSEETWKIANPNYGVSLKPDYVASECKKAIENPYYENTFRRLHLNQWTEQKTRWLKVDDWKACKSSSEPIPRGAYVVGGLDLSSTTDVTAYCRLAPVGEGWKAEWRFYIPEDRARIIADRDRVPYDAWIRDGWVTATPGKTVDYNFVERDIKQDANDYDLHIVGYDPWNARGLEQRLEWEGVSCVEIRQGPASLSAACKELERSVIAGSVDHGNNPVAEWMISNVEVKTDPNGNIRPCKPEHHASGKKIDGVSALVTAIAVSMANPSAGESMYDEPGGLTL